MTPADAYAELVRRSKELGVLNSCAAVLGWDQQTYMPAKGAGLRGDQMAFLAALSHQKFTDPKVGELLATVEGSDLVKSPEADAAANVREWRRAYDRATKLPEALVSEMARVTTQAQQAWEQAKRTNQFATFRPLLERVVELKRQEADAVLNCGTRSSERGVKAADKPGGPDSPSASIPNSEFRTPHLYDALIEEYEPGTTVADLKALFAGLTAQLVPLIQKFAHLPKKPDRSVLEREYPVDRQKLFAESAAIAIGYDFAAGRLDTTSHPFCSGFGPGDCRITTRYNPRSFSDAFFGVLHETGHALYEQNLPAEHFGTPLGVACSFGVHESQSRLWENQVGRGRPFWDHFFPRLRQAFPAAVGDVSPDAFYAAINDVRPSFIRVEADEATYNLHIALRFELELALLSGDLAVVDLPDAWNTRFTALFGLPVPDDTRGCLQDIHWAFGGIGYFPTYTLGNLYAAQFMAAVKSQLGVESLESDIRRGEFGRLKEWLVKNIHRNGQRYRAAELCRRVTGDSLSPAPFVAHLNEKYTALHAVC
ncbi:peptidase m32 : Carboxypeptidase Taq OS=Marinithermus hydrothermalis (strain DSM 14884 / JCM 11576 / T1) GN=Marky_0327 PE=4 SV=1: Peptidase_M32 [Gemmataceae bacterium]|nr:peptidase m32 : Carboxypeptidase Taq OS=Marinithermus hydrothermalis (strain DSM 14884 / JCM 11576 / T1) GN=Marky_0327 PE=4 SV=1: Peptidase_M32 [Gemmataceae bacterium]VTU01767.1 peptidase m32 : Carboxypeptidase Taq OS=Marinithermus hydrothermalis (strain DSM 14884 / JCM 11576 / T1) GN=Marky_0327 PE=4 SV=1: Peptidase_M32 [Gemmataceae bacterium]